MATTHHRRPGVVVDSAPIRLSLLNGFDVRVEGRPIVLPFAAQRLLGFLAVRDQPLRREFVAASLWMDCNETRARGNLRSALSRLRASPVPLVDSTGKTLSVAKGVWVDLREAIARARDALRDDAPPGELDPSLLAADLLPGWYDDWVVLEQERLRQLRLHALEALCNRLTAAGRYAEAIDVGLTAVAADPLRESSHRALMEVHIAEGNRSETLREYTRYSELLRSELGLEPSADLRRLVGNGRGNGRAVRTNGHHRPPRP